MDGILLMMNKKLLERLYLRNGMSMQGIATKLECSMHKVQYWMKKHGIPSRSRSDAMYLMHHPNGDPFMFDKPRNKEDMFLFGLGLGLYWGEGTKSNKTSVRLGNTDPLLIGKFMEFLLRFFHIQQRDLRFGLQIFSDIDGKESLRFWTKHLGVHKNQFYGVTRTQSGAVGTYRKKNRNGVVTVYYNNKKLRDILVGLLPP